MNLFEYFLLSDIFLTIILILVALKRKNKKPEKLNIKMCQHTWNNQCSDWDNFKHNFYPEIPLSQKKQFRMIDNEGKEYAFDIIDLKHLEIEPLK